MFKITLSGLMLQPPKIGNSRRLVTQFAMRATALRFQIVAVDRLAHSLLAWRWHSSAYITVSGRLDVDVSQGVARWLVYPQWISRAVHPVDSCDLQLRGWVSRPPRTIEGETEFSLLLDDAQLLATYYVVSRGPIGEALRNLRLRPSEYVEVVGRPSVILWRNYKRQLCLRHLITPHEVRRLAWGDSNG